MTLLYFRDKFLGVFVYLTLYSTVIHMWLYLINWLEEKVRWKYGHCMCTHTKVYISSQLDWIPIIWNPFSCESRVYVPVYLKAPRELVKVCENWPRQPLATKTEKKKKEEKNKTKGFLMDSRACSPSKLAMSTFEYHEMCLSILSKLSNDLLYSIDELN